MKKLSKYFEDMVLSPEPNAFCMLKPGFNQYKDEFERLLKLNGWKIIKHCTKQFTRPEIEDFYMGKITEFHATEDDDQDFCYTAYVPDDIVFEGKDAICRYLDLQPETTMILKDDGYEKVYKYVEIE